MRKMFLSFGLLWLLLLYTVYFLFHPRLITGQEPTPPVASPTSIKINEAQAEIVKKVLDIFTNAANLPPSPTPTPAISVLPTPTPMLETPTPTPTVPFSYPAEFQAQLVALFADQIRNNCIQDGIIGRITNDNSSCLNNVKMPPADQRLLDLARAEMKSSATENYHLQCVKFVNASALLTTGYLPQKNGKIAGNAIDYAYNIPDNYKLYKVKDGARLEPADIVVYNYETFGHIAIVIKIYDENTFQVAEGNFDAHGTVERNRIDTKDNPNLIGWLRFSPPEKAR